MSIRPERTATTPAPVDPPVEAAAPAVTAADVERQFRETGAVPSGWAYSPTTSPAFRPLVEADIEGLALGPDAAALVREQLGIVEEVVAEGAVPVEVATPATEAAEAIGHGPGEASGGDA